MPERVHLQPEGLACTKILNESEQSENSGAYITSVIYGRENEYAARIAGDDTSESDDLFSVKNDRLELLMMENTVSKIMTHTCRHNGLSQVFTEIFNFSGHEFYIARPEMNEKLYEAARGKTIRQINRILPGAIAFGIIQKDGSVLIADPNIVVLGEGCQLLLLQEDDDRVIPSEEKTISYTPPTELYVPEPSSILIIGCNEKLPYILREMGAEKSRSESMTTNISMLCWMNADRSMCSLCRRTNSTTLRRMRRR